MRYQLMAIACSMTPETDKTLSTRQQQRICLIRGLLLSPEVVLMDEPTSALDEDSGRRLYHIVSEIA